MLLAEEGGRGVYEFGPLRAKDGAMATVRHDPETRARDGFGHFKRKFDWIQMIAVALNDERTGLDGGEQWGREVHVVIAVGKGAGACQQGVNLVVSAGVATTQDFPLRFGKSFGVIAHDRASLRGEIGSGANQYHGGDALGLASGHVEQDVAASADSDGFAAADFEVIEQGKHIGGCVLMSKRRGKCAGAAMPAQVRDDQAEVGAEIWSQ